MVYGTLLVERRSYHIYQTLKCADGYPNTIMSMRKSSDSGATWSEWEYINPPMQLGVEYRTTERWLGKPVYVKTLDVGYVGIGMTTKHHNIQMTQCLSCLGFESGNDTMPAKYDDSSIDVYKNIYANNTQIIIYSNTDSNRYTHCTLKYTKD